MIQVTCPNCGLTILAPPAVQGRKGVCFGCGGPLRVPHSSQDAGLDDLAYAPGTRISDRYVIDESIGRGGMGVVYRADDTLMSETVALKFMYPKLLRTQKGHNLFVQEAQVARRLRHDNIVAVHDVTSTPEGILYLSMEFLQGKSLRAFLRHRRRVRKLMSVRLAVRVVTQALSALEHAHRTVVHRDMKPENIMVLPGERVKVLDFGLAKALDEEARDPATDEKPKRIVGTEAYAAPEQKRHEDLDGRADLYSTGLILREMLTLRTPAEDQVAVQAVRGDVAPSLLEVLDKAIHPNREARWQTAGAFRDALLAAFEKSYRAPEAAAVQTASGKNVSTDGMVYLEGGSFLMGNNGNPVEAPEYAASVDAFYMDACPVTVAQYAEFLEATGHAPPEFWKESDFDGDDQPVVGVTWNDAQAYARWAGKQLPTEAQWEFAARGKENRRYPWGNQEPDRMSCNYGEFMSIPSIVTLHEDGATPEGIFDLAGNVHEWTADRFVPYGKANDAEPRRAVRGGGWDSPPSELRCTARRGFFPETRAANIGFRCVAPAERAE